MFGEEKLSNNFKELYKKRKKTPKEKSSLEKIRLRSHDSETWALADVKRSMACFLNPQSSRLNSFSVNLT